ncbi:hypothetical protein MP638_006632 [Amoeboaphelidium occidentale]|nr:hypothetical protein MP638_006632 [Amoeboaphelidium occidentale]
MAQYKQLLQKLTSENSVIVFSTTYCGYCVAVKRLFSSLNVPFLDYNFDNEPNGDKFREYISNEMSYHTVPMVFIRGKFVKGADDVKRLHSQNKLLDMVNGKL